MLSDTVHADPGAPADPGAVLLRAARDAFVRADEAARWSAWGRSAAVLAARAAAADTFVRAAVEDGDPEALLDALAEVYNGVVLDDEWIERYSQCQGVEVRLHVENGKVSVLAVVYDRRGYEVGEEWVAQGLAPTDSDRIWAAISDVERGE